MISYRVTPIPIKGNETRYVLKIEIDVSSIKPVFVHIDRASLVFVRDFGLTRSASSEEIRSLVLLSEQVSYDSLLTSEIYKEEDFTKLQNVAIQNTGNKLSIKQLISIGFINCENKLSQGALLFKDDCACKLCRIDVSFYPSINKGERLIFAPKTFLGSIIDVIDQSSEYLISHFDGSWYKTDSERKNISPYPIRSLREGICNALCHRNYYLTTSVIEIDVYVDRLEIVSPGSLLGVSRVTKETDISSISPKRRNEVIARTLEAIHYVENKGSGFDLIAEEYYHEDTNHKPFITSDQNHFVLTLANLNYSKGIIDEENDSPNVFVDDVTLSPRDLSILSFCYVNNKSASEIAKMLGISSSTYFKKNILANLINKGLLISDNNKNHPTYISNHTLVKLSKH